MIKLKMTKLKCQIKLKIQMIETKILTFKHLDLNWNLDFDI